MKAFIAEVLLAVALVPETGVRRNCQAEGVWP